MSVKKNFSIDARTLIHLGRESIKDHTTALVELVKNSYDADADNVEIDIFQHNGESHIRVADDGIGMDESDIDQNWLRIGFSEKRNDKISTKGRRKTGEKGIGRLSTDRLGETLQIITKKENSVPFGLLVDWELFNQEKADLAQVPLEVMESPGFMPLKGSSKNSGTEMLIYKLRDQWTKENIESLIEELSILTSPFVEVQDFEIRIKNDIVPELNGRIPSADFVIPEIELTLSYDGNKNLDLSYTIKDQFHEDQLHEDTINWRSLTQKVIDPFKHSYHEESLDCGPVKIKLLLYPRSKVLAENTDFTLQELKDYVNKNVGIKIYRDNISVKPYGYKNGPNSGDWVGLAERHMRNPAGVARASYRVVPNQLVGAIFISRDNNPHLLDSASREGLVENTAFYDLRALTLGAVALLENYRYMLYQRMKTEKTVKTTATEISHNFKRDISTVRKSVSKLKELFNAPITHEGIKKIQHNVEEVAEFIDKSEKISSTFDYLLNHNRVLAGMATVGIASVVFGHEIQSSITEVYASTKTAKKFLEHGPGFIDRALPQLDSALEFSDRIGAWGNFALTRAKKNKRQIQEIDVKQIIQKIIDEFEAVLSIDEVNIKICLDLDSCKSYLFPMDIESIILNILTNAYSACMQKGSDRKIRISLHPYQHNEKDGFLISIANSGDPVDEKFKEWIWEPLNTLKKDSDGKEIGTGLGLFIVKSIVEELHGYKEVGVATDLGGADFRIWIPVKKK